MLARGNTCFKAIPIPDFDATIETLYVTFVQNDYVVLEKNLNDVTFDKLETDTNHVIVRLVQSETLKFKYTGIPSKDAIKVQLRLRTDDNEAYSSSIMVEQLYDALKGGLV